jgi:hypothetical protein
MTTVRDRVKREPDIFLRLAQNSMVVAASLRERFVENTLDLADQIRQRLQANDLGGLSMTDFTKTTSTETKLDRITVCFIDGGVGEAEIFFRIPLIVRGGIFRIKEGERDLEKRETFEFFPVLIGDLEGGEKSRGDYSTVVRTIIELCSVLRVLGEHQYSDVNLIMLHGPLLYRLSAYTDHWFFEKDIDIMTETAGEIIREFREGCKNCPIYNDNWCPGWKLQKKVRANCLIAFLLSKAIKQAAEKGKSLVGVVERASATELSKVLFERMLRTDAALAQRFLGRCVENYSLDAEKIVTVANFTDPLIFSLVLGAGEYTSFYPAEERYRGFTGKLSGFRQKLPAISYTYLKPVDNAMAIRVEFPMESVENQETSALFKVYEYSRLLPNYAFPIGLDIADKFAKVPNWLIEAYRKYILFNFGRLSLDKALDEQELRRLLMFYYLHQRDFALRPPT